MKLILTCPLGHRQEIAIKPGTKRPQAELLADLFSRPGVTTACQGKGHAFTDEYCGKPFKAKVVDDGTEN